MRSCTATKSTSNFFWLKDEALEEMENLPDPNVLAQEIVGNLEAMLPQFESIAEELGDNG